jgi:hypothetical protein
VQQVSSSQVEIADELEPIWLWATVEREPPEAVPLKAESCSWWWSPPPATADKYASKIGALSLLHLRIIIMKSSQI